MNLTKNVRFLSPVKIINPDEDFTDLPVFRLSNSKQSEQINLGSKYLEENTF